MILSTLKRNVGAQAAFALRPEFTVRKRSFGLLLNKTVPRRDLTEAEMSIGINIDMNGRNLVYRKGSKVFGDGAVTDLMDGSPPIDTRGEFEIVSAVTHKKPNGSEAIFMHIRPKSTGTESIVFMESDSSPANKFQFLADLEGNTTGKSTFVSRFDNTVFFVCQPVEGQTVRNRVIEFNRDTLVWSIQNMGIEADETIQPTFKRKIVLQHVNATGVGKFTFEETITGSSTGFRATVDGVFFDDDKIQASITNQQTPLLGETITGQTSGVTAEVKSILTPVKIVLTASTINFNSGNRVIGETSGASGIVLEQSGKGVLIDLDSPINTVFGAELASFIVGEDVRDTTSNETRKISLVDNALSKLIRGAVGYVITRIRKDDNGIVLSESSPTKPIYVRIADWQTNANESQFLPGGNVVLDVTDISDASTILTNDTQITHFRLYRTANLLLQPGDNTFDRLFSDANPNQFRLVADFDYPGITEITDITPDNLLDPLIISKTAFHAILPNGHEAANLRTYFVISDDKDIFISANRGDDELGAFQTFPLTNDTIDFVNPDGTTGSTTPKGGKITDIRNDGALVTQFLNLEDDLLIWKENRYGFIRGSADDPADQGIRWADIGSGEVLGSPSTDSGTVRNKRFIIRTTRGIRMGTNLDVTNSLSQPIKADIDAIDTRDYGIFFNDKYILFSKNKADVLRFNENNRLGNVGAVKGWITWEFDQSFTYKSPLIIEDGAKLIAFTEDSGRWYQLEEGTVDRDDDGLALSNHKIAYTASFQPSSIRPRSAHITNIEMKNAMSVFASLTADLRIIASSNFDENAGVPINTWNSCITPEPTSSANVNDRDFYEAFFEPTGTADNGENRRVNGELLDYKFITSGDFTFFGYDLDLIEWRRRIQSTNFRFSDGVEEDLFVSTDIEQDLFVETTIEQDVFGAC